MGTVGGSGLSKRMSRRALLREAGAVTVGVGLASLTAPFGITVPRRAKAAPVRELTMMNPSRGLARALGPLATRYENQRGVKVTIDTPGPVEYSRKLLAAAQTNTMPDVYIVAASGVYAPFFKAGWALPLKPELDKGWKDNFSRVALDLVDWRPDNPFGVAPGIYYVPLEMSSFQMLYNPALFEKAKLPSNRVPFTMPQFVEALKALKSAGIGPFTTAVDAIPFLVQAFVSNWLTDKEIETTHTGKLPWASTAYKKALQLFVDLNDAGLIFNNALNWPWAEMEKSFYNVREVGVIYDGAWSIAVQRATAPEFTAYGSFRVPRAADAKHGQRSVGMADRNIAINAKGRNLEESLAFVKWLSDKEQAEFLMDTLPIVPTNPAALLDSTRVPPQFGAFAIEASRAQRVATFRSQMVDEAFTKGVQALLLKRMTIDQVLQDVDKAQKS